MFFYFIFVSILFIQIEYKQIANIDMKYLSQHLDD